MRRPRPDRLRPRHRPPQLRRRTLADEGRADGYRGHGAAHATSTGTTSRACRSSRRCAARRRSIDVYGPAAGGRPARRGVRRGDAARRIFPITPDRARRRRSPSTTPATTTSRSDGAKVRSPLGAPHRPHARLPRRDGRRLGRVPLRPRARHACPTTPTTTCPPDVLELCDGVDLLIHDAQHTAEEYEIEAHWGHCTIDYAVHVAQRSRRARSSRCSTTARRTATTSIDKILRDARELVGADRTAPRCSPRPRACVTSSPGAADATRACRDPTSRRHPTTERFRDRARSLRDRRHDHHRDGRRRAGRHGRATRSRRCRSTRRSCCSASRDTLDHVAAHRARRHVRGEHPRRGPRGALAAVRARRAPTASRRRRGTSACPARPCSTTPSPTSTAASRPSTPAATTRSSSGGCSTSTCAKARGAPVLQGRLLAHARGLR